MTRVIMNVLVKGSRYEIYIDPNEDGSFIGTSQKFKDILIFGKNEEEIIKRIKKEIEEHLQ